MQKRLAILGLVPAPYREPLYQGLSQRPDWATRVFYMQSHDSVRGWSNLAGSYDAVHLRCLTPEYLYSVPLIGVLNTGLVQGLTRFDPDCLVIHGYSYWPQLQAVRWAVRNGRPFFLCADSNAQKLAEGSPVAKLKSVWLRYCCRRAAGVLSVGSSNETFWRHYGVDAGRQFRSPLAVDNDFFSGQAAIYRGQKNALRRQLGLPEGRLALYVGRFAAEKNLENLLRAVAACGAGNSFVLALVGDGPERFRIARLITKLGLRNVFQFGFQAQSELPKFYGIADALVLASSYEPWGLVANEAMASGLPILLSKNAGCAPDLLEEGENGFAFDPADVNSIAACLKRFSNAHPEELSRMGNRSAQLIAGWSYREALAGILNALDAVGIAGAVAPDERHQPAASPAS